MLYRLIFIGLILFSQIIYASDEKPTIVKFSSATLTLQGELFKPDGEGPFPAVLYNHGSAPKMLNSKLSAILGPMFAKRGWVFFMPYRRGQGLSEDQGPYIMDEINSAKWSLFGSSSKTMVELLKTDHLNDQMAALKWLKEQKFVQANCIAAMGNSFGGIETILGMSKADYFAGVDASGGAQSWKHSDELQLLMKNATDNIHKPIFFFQAENDYDLSPSKELSLKMTEAKKVVKLKIYPPFGNSPEEGHSFAYRGVSVWFEDVFLFLVKYRPQKGSK